MAVSVHFFNADSLVVNVNINNGANTFQIPAADPHTWLPGVPSKNPSFSGGAPQPGMLGIGVNNVVLTPDGALSPFIAQIVLSPSVNWVAIQVYVFFQSYASCSWLVLNAGAQISQASTLSEGALKMATLRAR